MASKASSRRLSFSEVLSAALQTARVVFPEYSRHELQHQPISSRLFLSAFSTVLFLTAHCVPARAADIARDTPSASMAMAVGLYAAPSSSAAVSTVSTPVVSVSPLPPESAPQKVVAASPSVVVTSPPAEVHEAATTEAAAASSAPRADWTNYVAMIAGIVGAIAGIAGAIMGGLGLRRANRLARRD